MPLAAGLSLFGVRVCPFDGRLTKGGFSFGEVANCRGGMCMTRNDVIISDAREAHFAAGEKILGLVRNLDGEGLLHRGSEKTMVRGGFRGTEVRGTERFRGEFRGAHRGAKVRGTEKFRGEFRGMHRGTEVRGTEKFRGEFRGMQLGAFRGTLKTA